MDNTPDEQESTVTETPSVVSSNQDDAGSTESPITENGNNLVNGLSV